MKPMTHLDPNPVAQPRIRPRTVRRQDAQKAARADRARQARQRRARGKWAVKRGRLAAMLGLVALMGGAGVWGATGGIEQTRAWGYGLFERGSGAMGLALTEVQVSGQRFTSESDILTALAVFRGTPILTFDLSAAKARLEALPWITEARLTRQLPSGLNIAVTERSPAALWWDGHVFHLVAIDGGLIEGVLLDPFESLPRLAGAGAHDRVTEAVNLFSAQNPDNVVLYAELVSARRWSLHLENGQVVHLPEERPLAAWTEFNRVADQHGLIRPDVESVDLRLNDRIIVHEKIETSDETTQTDQDT